MSKSTRNRFSFDENEGSPAEESQEFVFADETESGSVLLDEAAPRKSRIRLLISAGALLFLTILGTVGYLYYTGRIGSLHRGDTSGTSVTPSADESATRDRFYIPDEPVSRELSIAIAAYRSGEREKARRLLEDFVNSSLPDSEKAIALVFQGIMEMETERYQQARHSFQRALRYDSNQVAAYVNLAVVSRKLGNPEDARSYATRAKELAPDDPSVTVVLGNLLADESDLEGAENAYRSGIETSPEDPLLHYNLGLSLLRKDRREEAELEFSRAADYAAGGRIAALSHAHIGQIRFHNGRYAAAVDSLKKAVALAPDNGRFHYNLAVAYLRMDRKEEALDQLKLALEAGSSSSDLYRALAKVYLQYDQSSMAIVALKKAIYSNPEDVDALFELGGLYTKEQDLLNAVEIYKKIVNITPGNAATLEALNRLGESYTRMERYEDAVSTYRKALELESTNSDALYGLGFSYHKRGEPDRAVAYWKRALETPGVRLDREKEKRIRMSMASLYRREQAYDLALDEYRAILKRNQEAPVVQEDPPVDLEMGETLFLLKDFAGARVSYRKVSESVSARPDARKDAFEGMALSYYEEKTPESLQLARENAVKASRLDPSDPHTNMTRAKILLATGSVLDSEKAIEILRAITESDVDARIGSRAYNLLGEAYFESGEYLRSLEALDYAIQLDPSFAEAFANRRRAANAYEKSLGKR